MKHFTLDEARSALEDIKPLVDAMVRHRRRLRALEERLDSVRTAVSGNGGGLRKQDVDALETAARDEAGEVARCVTAIQDAGVQVKDLDVGLVDFPAVHPGSGETVLLCWHLGEDDIAHWHGLNEGFAGRKPLPF